MRPKVLLLPGQSREAAVAGYRNLIKGLQGRIQEYEEAIVDLLHIGPDSPS